MHPKRWLVSITLVAALAGRGPAAWAGEDEQTHDSAPAGAAQAGKGFVFGVGFGPGQLDFGGDADDSALFVGPIASTERFCSYSTCTVTQLRSGRVAPRDSAVPGASRAVLFPASQGAGSISLVLGWSFSDRVAVLFDGDFALKWGEGGFDNLAGAFVVRYSPARRWWLEAGPAFGELAYHYDYESFDLGVRQSTATLQGAGALAATGYELVKHRTWRLDAQARIASVWYEGVRATTFSVQLGWLRRRS